MADVGFIFHSLEAVDAYYLQKPGLNSTFYNSEVTFKQIIIYYANIGFTIQFFRQVVSTFSLEIKDTVYTLLYDSTKDKSPPVTK